MKIYFLALTILVAIPIQVKGVIELQMNSKFSAVPVVFDRYFRCIDKRKGRNFKQTLQLKCATGDLISRLLKTHELRNTI